MTRLHENTSQIDHAVIELLKPVVKKLLETYFEKVPAPSRGNTTGNRNTQNLIELRDWFFTHFDLPEREKALRGAMNFGIIHVDFDAPYRLWFLALLKEAMAKEWDFSEHEPFHWK